MTLKRKNLHKYQRKAVEFIDKKRFCALFLDMGLGKTVIALTAALDQIKAGKVKRVLVIGPLRVANTVWHTEIMNWAHLEGLSYAICTGTEYERSVAVKMKPDILITSRENVPWLIEHVKDDILAKYQRRKDKYGRRKAKRPKWPWDMLIIDESSSFKNQSTKRFAAIRKTRQYMRSIVLLTGTPAPNGHMDLWSQIYLLDGGKRLGRFITHFREKYFDTNPYTRAYKIKKKSAKKINKKIKDLCLSMSAEDYLDLPPIIYLNEFVSPPKKALKQYNELEKEFLLELEEGVEIEANFAASLQNKLLQMCNGFIYEAKTEIKKGQVDKEGLPKLKKYNVPHHIHGGKIKALSEIIEDNAGENFMIAYNFKEDLDVLKKAFPDAVILSKSGKELKRWNGGKINKLLVHPASSGHGINAQYGGSILVWYGLNWSLELYQQLNKRLHRQGQTKPVRVMHIVTKGWLDEDVMEALGTKAKNQQQILDYVKKKLKKKQK